MEPPLMENVSQACGILPFAAFWTASKDTAGCIQKKRWFLYATSLYLKVTQSGLQLPFLPLPITVTFEVQGNERVLREVEFIALMLGIDLPCFLETRKA